MNKKIAILTFHRACNYGAFLQGYSLQKSLDELPNVEAFLLDYHSHAVYDGYTQFGLLRRKANPVKNIIAETLLFTTIWRRNQVFERFRKQHYRVLRENLKQNELPQAAQDYDGIVVGSDQVWNTEITKDDSSYLLDFVPDTVKKFAYAASIGRDDLNPEELEQMTSALQSYCGISLREPELIPKLEGALSGMPIRCDMDPVFLRSAQQWRQFSQYEHRSPYVLCFTLGTGKQMVPCKNFARELAQQRDLKPLLLSSDERWFSFRDIEHFGIASPAEFVGLIDHAECVVTHSFHATAFSIILHTPFFVEMNTLRNGRLKNLLELTGLTDRVIVNGMLQQEPKPIDWDDVDARLAGRIEDSKAYLRRIAEICGE